MFPLVENKAHDLFFRGFENGNVSKRVVVGCDAEQTIQDE